jgi:hypothetical protein
MKTTTLNYSSWLPLSNSKTYIFSLLFIAGNVLLPQLCHVIPNGGPMLLPIFFFTLIGAFHYGLYVGLITAILSPLASHFLVGMPTVEILPVLLVKSVTLAVCASLAARYFQKISLPVIALVILSYQIIGSTIEFLIIKDFYLSLQNLRIAIPGMLIQIFGGYYLIK